MVSFIIGVLGLCAVTSNALALQLVAPDGAEMLGASAGETFCQCCWRDCEPSSEVSQGLAASEENTTKYMFEGDAATDAWLVLCDEFMRGSLDWNMYTPILETVKVAVERMGAKAQVIRVTQMRRMLEGVKAAAAIGGRPLVFSVGFQFAPPHDIRRNLETIKAAREAGAYVVAYQTEPLHNVNTVSGQAALAKVVLHLAEQMGAHEIWDYSMVHKLNYPPTKLLIRWVPPGYVPKLDVGVNVRSPRANASAIGYIGSPDKQMHDRYRELFAGTFHESNNIFSSRGLRDFLEAYPLQLNTHRFQTCCPRNIAIEAGHQHFESFRMSILLANKACVMSAPSSDADMKIWHGIVNFVEFENAELMKNQLATQIDQCRMRSYEAYKRDFEPSKLLQISGFFKVWSPPHGK